MMRKLRNIALALLMACAGSCIDPPLHLPGDDVVVDVPIVITDMEIVWNADMSWKSQWHYGWDQKDTELWGPIEYPTPKSFEIRRYYLGDAQNAPHTEVDAFSVTETKFRRYYNFGYYDMLLWSNIESPDGTQVLKVDESDLDNVVATTSVTKGMKLSTKADDGPVTGIFNQPEIFYATYPRNIYISRFFDDYDYYDPVEGVYVKQIETDLAPRVFIYLVQVIFYNNEDGRIKGVTGNGAMSAFATSVSVNSGHTSYDAGTVYINTRMKKDIVVDGRKSDIAGSMFTTFGLSDMMPVTKAGTTYSGLRGDLPNFLYLDVIYSNNVEGTLKFNVTEQCQAHCTGGLITVYVDCHDIVVPDGPDGGGSLFVPSIDDYDEVIYDIPME